MQYCSIIVALAMTLAVTGCEKEEFDMVNEANPETVRNLDNYPVATFGGGCFWGVEYNFRRVPGVLGTEVGFMGGAVDNPSYKQVCYEDTNHAEVVHLRYDPKKVSYEKLVKIFFKLHNPTTLNRQGPDVGTQYRSAVFYHDDEQKQTSENIKTQLELGGEFKRPIVTEITEAKDFWKAEDYHQQYIEKNPLRRCHVINFDEIKKILEED